MPTKMALAMAPPFRPWKAGEAPEHGNSLISTFFKRSRKGRPKKSGTLAADKVKVNVVKRGRPPSKEQNSAPKPTKASPKAAAPTSQTAQKKDPPGKRTNWTLPENQAVLQKAVDDWLEEQDSCYDSNGEKMALKVYANMKGIPYDTFKKYVCPDETKRRKVGNAAGRQALVPANQQKFLVKQPFGTIEQTMERVTRK